MVQQVFDALKSIIGLGGPVVAILLCLSVISVAVALYKIVQYLFLGVGRHGKAVYAVGQWSANNKKQALATVGSGGSMVETIAANAMRECHARHFEMTDHEPLQNRLLVEAEHRLSRLERGFRMLDSIAQIAPLLGLFGTVLGMIEAFQKLQNAGNAVDPSILAGGIWVALLTTAVGLAVAMPTSLFLTYFESRVARERAAAELAISRIVGSGTVHDQLRTASDAVETSAAPPATMATL